MACLDSAPQDSAEQSHTTKGLVRLTMACNERCPFCNVPVEDYAVRTLPDDQLELQLSDFVASGARTLTISGGEPTLLRKKLCKLVADARSRGVPYVELQTNAVLIDESYARELFAAGLTSAFVSLLSHVAEHHDSLAGLAEAFPRCLAGIDALLDAGIRVTLNPVVAAATQELLPDYIDFVATRLHRVRSISLSAVQPHGRARKNLDLLPDYAVLGRVIPLARQRAAAADIELLNPYCGLPACIGWADALESSVEAIEAEEPLPEGGAAIGLINRGDKRHGPQCRRCALRSRCGGAWHAYWDHRGGSGLQPPIALVPPWEGASASETPTVWGSDPDASCTDVALVLDPDHVDLDLLRRVRARLRVEEYKLPQRRKAVHIAVGPGSAHGIHRAVGLVKALGLPDVTLLGRTDPRLREALAREWQLEVRCFEGATAAPTQAAEAPRQDVPEGGLLYNPARTERRFHLLNLGLPRTGTTTVAAMFGAWRAGHEFWGGPLCEVLSERHAGRKTTDDVSQVLRARDQAGRLEVDSASFLHLAIEELVKLHPTSAYVLTWRPFEPWFDSFLDLLLRQTRKLGSQHWSPWEQQLLGLMLGKLDAQRFESAQALRPALPELASAALDFWVQSMTRTLAALPSHALVLPVSQLSHAAPALARLVGVPEGSVLAKHENAGEPRDGSWWAQVPAELQARATDCTAPLVARLLASRDTVPLP